MMWRWIGLLEFACLAMAALVPSQAAVPSPDVWTTLGTGIASPAMLHTTDRTLSAALGPAVKVGEVHGGDCNTSLRITGGRAALGNTLAVLRLTPNCAAPKIILALRLTFAGPGAEVVLAAMRHNLGASCMNGPGVDGALTEVWSNQGRLTGVVRDLSPSEAFSVIYVSHQTTGDTDPAAEAQLRSLMEADLPIACRMPHSP